MGRVDATLVGEVSAALLGLDGSQESRVYPFRPRG